MLGEHKARLGSTSVFSWVSPDPIEDAPTLTLHPASGTVGPLTLVRVASDVTVTGLDASDRRILTTTAVTAPTGMPIRFARAHLLTEEEGAFPVVVASIEAGRATLSEPLPRDLTLTVTATLRFAGFSVALPTSLTDTAQRDVRWVVEYAPDWGGDAPTVSEESDTGLIHVVPQPFDTRVTHQDLAQHMRTLGGTVPRSQQDWGPQLEMGAEELVLWLRSKLAELKLTEDDVPAPQSLRLAHMYFAAAAIYDITDAEKADSLRARAEALATQATRRIWVDANQDGVVDDGEEETQITGGRSTDVGYSSSQASTASRLFSIGGVH